MKRLLVTTALEETWRNNEPVLFLGEWCRRFSRREHWLRMDAEVLPYHWDDRIKLHSDYVYLKDLHERLLQDLTAQLNGIHGVDHSLRYWRILIGPWLNYYTPVLLDSWNSIRQAIVQYELGETIVLTGNEGAMVPFDMEDFNSRLYTDDKWIHHNCSEILQRFTAVPCTRKMWTGINGMSKAVQVSNWKRQIKRKLVSSYIRAASTLSRDQDAFFLASYLPMLDEMKLYRRLGQVPQLWRSVQPTRAAVDFDQRQWVMNGKNHSEFEVFVRSMIPGQIPVAYLEGYHKLVKQVAALPWPKQPKLIWTSNAFASDDVFKAWAAQNVEQGTPLVIGQHGGHYGIGRWSSYEDHEIAISDCYLSWGWSDSDQPKVKPLGQLKAKRPFGVRHAEQAGALLVTATVPRQSFPGLSSMVSRQWLDYFSDQCTFVESLPEPIRAVLTVRLHSIDFGWDQVARWRDRFPDLHLDAGQSNINDLIRQSRLYIATYNATTFLESFTMDVPTVIYWNPAHWELRDSAVPYFKELQRVGIFHENPNSAARHVANIWDDVDAWWSSSEVRDVLTCFKERYSRLPNDLLGRIESALREVIEDGRRQGPVP